MRAFQDEGHIGVLIVGDYTPGSAIPPAARPSGRSSTARRSTECAARFFELRTAILDPERTEVRYNGEWLTELDFAGVLRLTRTTTVARMLERDDFAKRFAPRSRSPSRSCSIRCMQAYDSVAVEADIELGGTDQLYNLLTGRDVMEAYGLEPQVVSRPSDRQLGRDEDVGLARQQHRAH